MSLVRILIGAWKASFPVSSNCMDNDEGNNEGWIYMIIAYVTKHLGLLNNESHSHSYICNKA